MHRSDTLLTLLTKDTSGKSFNLEQLQDSSDFFFFKSVHKPMTQMGVILLRQCLNVVLPVGSLSDEYGKIRSLPNSSLQRLKISFKFIYDSIFLYLGSLTHKYQW